MSRMYPVILVLGLLLMVGGVATTYIALGQDSENQPVEEVQTQEPTPTLEPTIEPVVVEQQPVQPVVEQPIVQPTQVIPPTLVPTEIVPPTAVPTEVTPPTVVPTEIIPPTLVPTEVIPPTVVIEDVAAISETIVPEQTEAVAPTEALPVVEQTEVVAPTEVIPPTEAVIVPEQTEAVVPTEVILPEQTEEVVPTEDIAPTVDPNIMPTLPPVSGGQSVPTVGPENPLEATATLMPTLEITATVDMQPTIDLLASATPGEILPTEVLPEATEELVNTGGLVRGSVSSTFGQGIALILTQPDGSTLETVTDEQGGFTFEGLLPGDYKLNATSLGALSNEAIFTLTEGQHFELPPTVLAVGDLNQDNQIDMNDVVLLAANYNYPSDTVGVDLNGDAWIDVSDLAIIGAQFGAVGPRPWS
jgi:hypothetical protein